FLRRLQANLLRATSDLGPVRVHQLPGRIVLDVAGRAELNAVMARLERVVGVANFALAERTTSSVEEMKRAAERVIADQSFTSFRITARRAFKTFPLPSMELNRILGADVLARHPLARVNLEHPGLNLHVEVLPGETFVYCDRRGGAGGLPVGSSGTVAALLSGGIDS